MPREDGYKNLVPLNKRTKEEQRTIQQVGGTASGVSRRRKRSLKEATDLYLSLPVKDKRMLYKIISKGVDPEDVDNQMAIIVGLAAVAANGDARAAKMILEFLGEDSHSEEAAVHPLVSDLVTAVKKRQEEDGHAE